MSSPSRAVSASFVRRRSAVQGRHTADHAPARRHRDSEGLRQEHNITVSDEDVDQEIEKIKEQVGEQARSSGQDLSDQEAYEQALKQNNITEEELREDIRENLPVQKVQEKVAGNAEPSDEEIQNFYEKNKEAQFTTPEQRCVRHILFNKDQEQKAEEVKQQLEDGGDFAELAKENSQDPGSAEKGGDLGCLGKGETVPELRGGGLRGRAGRDRRPRPDPIRLPRPRGYGHKAQADPALSARSSRR